MNHPTREELVAYSYGELTESARQNLEAHLTICPECKGQVGQWNESKRLLDAWTIPEAHKPISRVQPALKWAIAALFVLGIGFGVGYAASPRLDAAALRSELAASLKDSLATDIQAKLRQEFDSELEKALTAARATLANELTAALGKQLESAAHQTLASSLDQGKRLLAAYDLKRQEDERATLIGLKSYFDARLSRHATDLETVAVLTEATLRDAQRQISTLAGYTPVSSKQTQ